MGFVMKVIGYVLVLLGVICPAVGGYLYATREVELRTWWDTREDFSALDANERAVMAALLVNHKVVLDKAGELTGKDVK